MAEPTKPAPKKGSKPEDPRIAAARERMAAMSKGPSGAPRSQSQAFKDTIRELKLTTWPDRPTLIKSTYVVLTFIVVTSLFTFALDLLLTKATSALLSN